MKSACTKNASDSFFIMAREEDKRLAEQTKANKVLMDRNMDYLKHYD